MDEWILRVVRDDCRTHTVLVFRIVSVCMLLQAVNRIVMKCNKLSIEVVHSLWCVIFSDAHRGFLL